VNDTTKSVQKWADDAMFKAEESIPEPKAFLLQGTPDPLGSVAAFAAMYKGEVVRDKADVTDEERRYYLAEMQKTKLKAPLEAVNLHWMIEGVTRSFTHQMVRQRTAVYAQESLRFAVKEDAASAVALPPSLQGVEPFNVEEGGWETPEQESLRRWEACVAEMADAYNDLVNMGMPAEDARGLLPHNITTRLNYATNLRNYLDHAGNRLCTQAQFEWRIVWVRMLEAMRDYCTSSSHTSKYAGPRSTVDHLHDSDNYPLYDGKHQCDNWQWRAISELFRPVCYYTGNCQFLADFDRKCSIRDRVMEFAANGIPSSEWDAGYDVDTHPEQRNRAVQVVKEAGHTVFIGAIHPAEWLMDAGAAR
jgi:flavin-dependent thymidylate synthase